MTQGECQYQYEDMLSFHWPCHSLRSPFNCLLLFFIWVIIVPNEMMQEIHNNVKNITLYKCVVTLTSPHRMVPNWQQESKKLCRSGVCLSNKMQMIYWHISTLIFERQHHISSRQLTFSMEPLVFIAWPCGNGNTFFFSWPHLIHFISCLKFDESVRGWQRNCKTAVSSVYTIANYIAKSLGKGWKLVLKYTQGLICHVKLSMWVLSLIFICNSLDTTRRWENPVFCKQMYFLSSNQFSL